MKILITGSRGQLGLELIKQLETMGGHQVYATCHQNLDITDQQAVNDLVTDIKPEVVINCAAFSNVDACESNEAAAFRVNALGARNLSAAAFKVSAAIVQISTDYVFDGEGSTPLREYDIVNPLNCYGRSKALGEKLVMETNPRHFIVRTAWLYGEGGNFVRTILKLAGEKDEIGVVADQFGTPTSTRELASVVLRLIKTDNYGICHGTCEGWCSWYDFAARIFDIKGIDIKLTPITTEQLNRPAKRPRYSVLDNFMLKLAGMNSFKVWEEALEEYLKKEC